MSEAKSVHLPLLGKTVKLGAIRPKSPPRVLRLKNFLLGSAGMPPPDRVDYYTKARASIGRMYLNDQYGDCVIAGKAHSLGIWSANDGSPVVTFTDAQILAYYNKLKAGPGDSGCVITDVFDYLVSYGFTDDKGVNHKLDGYVGIDVTSRTEVKTAAYLFGGLTIGFNVTSAMVNKAAEGAVWTLTDFTRSPQVGGHDVTVCGHNDGASGADDPKPQIVGVSSDGVQVATWGVVLTFAWELFARTDCVTECYAALAPDWSGKDSVNAATGLDVTALKKALDQFRGGIVPPIPDPVVPPTPPVPPVPVPPVPVPPPPPPAPPPAPPAPVVYPEYRLTDCRIVKGGLFGQDTITGRLVPVTNKAVGLTLPDIQAVVADVLALLASDTAKTVEQAVWDVIQDAKAGKYGEVLADVLGVWPAAMLLIQQVTALVQKWRSHPDVIRDPIHGDDHRHNAAVAGSWWSDHAADLLKLLEDLLHLAA